ncbi:MAG: hypothetical protein WAW26_00405 [Anaerolineae bacterium]
MKRSLALVVCILVAVNLLLVYAYFRLGQQKKPVQQHALPQFPCPLPATYCGSYREVKANGRFYGIAWSLPPGTPIYSLFAGPVFPVRVIAPPSFVQPGLSLESLDKQWRAIYVFTGSDVIRYTVATAPGETLLNAREGNIASFGANLVLRLFLMSGEQAQVQTGKQFRFLPL